MSNIGSEIPPIVHISTQRPCSLVGTPNLRPHHPIFILQVLSDMALVCFVKQTGLNREFFKKHKSSLSSLTLQFRLWLEEDLFSSRFSSQYKSL